jgi:hypothetical protein
MRAADLVEENRRLWSLNAREIFEAGARLRKLRELIVGGSKEKRHYCI